MDDEYIKSWTPSLEDPLFSPRILTTDGSIYKDYKDDESVYHKPGWAIEDPGFWRDEYIASIKAKKYEATKHDTFEFSEDKLDIAANSCARELMVRCKYKPYMTSSKILKTVAKMRASIVSQIVNLNITPKQIECEMTPRTKEALIAGHKKTEMYGKKKPFIPCFDEYGNQLPDKLDLLDMKGITVKIIDPECYGEYYLQLKVNF